MQGVFSFLKILCAGNCCAKRSEQLRARKICAAPGVQPQKNSAFDPSRRLLTLPSCSKLHMESQAIRCTVWESPRRWFWTYHVR